ncbi:glycosyltransferase [Thiobacillus denitrificans]|uniref:Glycosyl transferase family 1 n=1 Tax=Thiobacillus denitrificans TaxID=36861 RepID=A0A125BBV0_THIDE|nr:glycosyltransferase [Thiobacillus denitrificans]KVW93512.1 glycosyl transferase family 1 [Thiobacillus denitrificans]
MNILIFTNTFTPHVGGVARSVEAFTEEYRKRGHRVLVVAPEFPDMPQDEVDVVRISAIQNFNASDFSVVLPIHPALSETIDAFRPDIVHSQHPFLLGMTAVRIARHRGLPLVFTHHTLYEQYTHYVPGDSPALKRFAIELATRYANLADQVFAPSESIRDLLQQRGVTTPIAVVPTGVRLENFAHGDGSAFRRQTGIPQDAFVVGHLGRLAPEKNLEFLAQAVADFLGRHPHAHFLVIGSGPSENSLRDVFARAGLDARLYVAGILQQQALADALHAMDLFAFASTSETQGMVLTEAMAAALPVVALDAPGAREVVRDRHNGRLLQEATPAAFSAALQWASGLPPESLRDLKQAALDTAEAFSMPRSADKALACYESLKPGTATESGADVSAWEEAMTAIKTEWDILKSVAGAGDAALGARLFSERED